MSSPTWRARAGRVVKREVANGREVKGRGVKGRGVKARAMKRRIMMGSPFPWILSGVGLRKAPGVA